VRYLAPGGESARSLARDFGGVRDAAVAAGVGGGAAGAAELAEPARAAEAEGAEGAEGAAAGADGAEAGAGDEPWAQRVDGQGVARGRVALGIDLRTPAARARARCKRSVFLWEVGAICRSRARPCSPVDAVCLDVSSRPR
jgi:hypothetical protein